MDKIIEVITEPETIREGSPFMIKIKVVKQLIYQELKDYLTYDLVKNYSYGKLKGD